MAHPDTPVSEAVDVQPADNDAAAVDAFDRYLSGDDEDETLAEGDEPEAEEPQDEGEEPEPVDETDESEEPAAPAIPAPVSWNAERKALFATFTPEQQQAVAAIEAERNAQVQNVTTEAAEAKRNARAEAESQLVEIQRQYAAELEQYAQAFEIQEPDYGLLASNPQAFAEQMAYYKQATAQRTQMAQQAAYAKQQADALDAQRLQQWEAEQQAILAREIPEWNDPAKRGELVEKLVAIGLDLGFTNEALSNVDATELKALHRISQDREKAARWDKLQSEKMAAVRAQKGKPAPITARPGTAQPQGSGQRRALAEATGRLRQSGSDADALAAFEAMGL